MIFNGLVFTNKYSGVIERESEGYFAERKGTTGNIYNCFASFDKDDIFTGHAKFSDLNKKQYNYKKDFYGNVPNVCICEKLLEKCIDGESFDISIGNDCIQNVRENDCKYIYADAIKVNENKNIFDRFLTTLILSLVVCLANIGLALFGFLLFRTPGDF